MEFFVNYGLIKLFIQLKEQAIVMIESEMIKHVTPALPINIG